jgi:hypothetical protein
MNNTDKAVELLTQANKLRVELQEAQATRAQASIADRQRLDLKEAALSRIESELAQIRPVVGT